MSLAEKVSKIIEDLDHSREVAGWTLPEENLPSTPPLKNVTSPEVEGTEKEDNVQPEHIKEMRDRWVSVLETIQKLPESAVTSGGDDVVVSSVAMNSEETQLATKFAKGLTSPSLKRNDRTLRPTLSGRLRRFNSSDESGGEDNERPVKKVRDKSKKRSNKANKTLTTLRVNKDGSISPIDRSDLRLGLNSLGKIVLVKRKDPMQCYMTIPARNMQLSDERGKGRSAKFADMLKKRSDKVSKLFQRIAEGNRNYDAGVLERAWSLRHTDYINIKQDLSREYGSDVFEVHKVPVRGLLMFMSAAETSGARLEDATTMMGQSVGTFSRFSSKHGRLDSLPWFPRNRFGSDQTDMTDDSRTMTHHRRLGSTMTRRKSIRRSIWLSNGLVHFRTSSSGGESSVRDFRSDVRWTELVPVRKYGDENVRTPTPLDERTRSMSSEEERRRCDEDDSLSGTDTYHSFIDRPSARSIRDQVEAKDDKTKKKDESNAQESEGTTAPVVHVVDNGEATLNERDDGESTRDLEKKDDKFVRSNASADTVTASVTLGRGFNGSTFLYRDVHANTLYAVKTLNLVGTDNRNQVTRELAALTPRRGSLSANMKKEISDTNCIVHLHGYHVDETDIHLILEYMNLAGLDRITSRQCRVPERVVAAITWQIATGLKFLHEQKRSIHRDMKPANILWSTDGAVKISDFGLTCRNFDGRGTKAFLGTRLYLSPERHEGICTTSSDMYGLGLIIAELLSGQHALIPDRSVMSSTPKLHLALQKAFESPYITIPFTDAVLSKTAKRLVERLLSRDHEPRTTASELLSSDWFKQHGIQSLSDSKTIVATYASTYSPTNEITCDGTNCPIGPMFVNVSSDNGNEESSTSLARASEQHTARQSSDSALTTKNSTAIENDGIAGDTSRIQRGLSHDDSNL